MIGDEAQDLEASGYELVGFVSYSSMSGGVRSVQMTNLLADPLKVLRAART